MPPQQPQEQSTPPAGNSDPNFNFIFNGVQKPKKRFSLPGGNNLTKIALFVVGGGTILGILIIALSVILGPKGVDSKQLTDVAARSNEIIRVSDAVVQQSRDLNTANLATTTSTTLTSEQAQIIAYLKSAKKKVKIVDLNAYQNKKTDEEIQSAAQNNRLGEYYNSYLKKNLTSYESSLKTAYDTARPIKLKTILNNAHISTHTILATPQLAGASSL